ncbi:hypothetical protein [Paenibacillus sp. y28]|uniref:hypothetical protein n=1 Tax=Paenibacillus sp. y28 TaxID=3129110 RepID=UPI0030181457
MSGPALPEALELGWDDQAHFHPYVFRWEELEIICRYLGKRPEFIVNPVVPLLLLYRFAPVTAADDEARIRQLLKAAWSSLGLFTDSEIETIIGKTVPKRGDLHWAPHAEFGWVLEGEAAYSLRWAEHDRFPFAQLQELVRGAGDGFE